MGDWCGVLTEEHLGVSDRKLRQVDSDVPGTLFPVDIDCYVRIDEEDQSDQIGWYRGASLRPLCTGMKAFLYF